MKRKVWIALLALLLIPAMPGLANAKDSHRHGHAYRGGKGHGGGHGYYQKKGHSGRGYYGKRYSGQRYYGANRGYYRQGYAGKRYYGKRYYGKGYYGKRYYGPKYSFYLGPGWYAPWSYPAYAYPYPYPDPCPYPYPYRRETTVIVGEPPVYIERPQRAAPPPAPREEAYWHYCESLGGYYPDVPSCPEDWIRVPPRPE